MRTPIMLFMTFFIILIVTVGVLCAAPKYGQDSRRDATPPYDGHLNW